MSARGNRLRWLVLGVVLLAGLIAAVAVGRCEGEDGPERTAPGDTRTRDTGAAPARAREGTPAGEKDAGPARLALAPTLPADRCGASEDATVEHARTIEGHCAWIFAAKLSEPRGLVMDEAGQALVVERGREQVTALFDGDGDRVAGPEERTALATAPGLNHGIWIHEGRLYASSASTVFRWPYRAGTREPLGDPEVVVRGIPEGGHTTRTLVTDAQSRLYVSVGSRSNVDPDSSRARIMRYDLSDIPEGGVDWESGELFADGLRNEVGIAFDARGRLWGVENGMDNLAREDLGGDIHADNPAEELNLFREPGRFYGYPYCWTEFRLPPEVGRGPGTQWADPRFLEDGTHDDAWCRDRSRVVPPRLTMQAHAAPLDLLFWDGGALPEALEGDALVSFHGSWNRPEPTGYKVVRIVFDGKEPVRTDPILEHGGPGDTGEDWPHRPVGLARGARGELLVTSDRSGVVLAVAAGE